MIKFEEYNSLPPNGQRNALVQLKFETFGVLCEILKKFSLPDGMACSMDTLSGAKDASSLGASDLKKPIVVERRAPLENKVVSSKKVSSVVKEGIDEPKRRVSRKPADKNGKQG